MCVKHCLGLILLGAAIGWPSKALAEREPGLKALESLNRALATAAEKVAPSVAVITIVRNQPSPSTEGDRPVYQNLPPDARREFEKYFEDIPLERRTGSGSGLILRKNGFILTNRHVVENSQIIRVTLRDGRAFPARLVASDPPSDLAILKIEAQDLSPAKFGDSDRARVGEFVLAVGSPYGLDFTVTVGHISAKGRNHVWTGALEGMFDENFIQTDALIGPGNSGGPLVNIYGEVLGINTLIQGTHAGIGFAVPGNRAREIAEQLMEQGKFPRSWLGLDLRDMESETNVPTAGERPICGVLISRVRTDGPAINSGLKEKDVIQSINGQSVNNSLEVRQLIRSTRAGQILTLGIMRERERMVVRVKTAEYIAATEARP